MEGGREGWREGEREKGSEGGRKGGRVIRQEGRMSIPCLVPWPELCCNDGEYDTCKKPRTPTATLGPSCTPSSEREGEMRTWCRGWQERYIH